MCCYQMLSANNHIGVFCPIVANEKCANDNTGSAAKK